MKPVHEDLTALEGVVAPKILQAARLASARLTSLGVRHALVGGLAVGVRGHSRAAKVVEFLVGDEAFEHHDTLRDLCDALALSIPADAQTDAIRRHVAKSDVASVPAVLVALSRDALEAAAKSFGFTVTGVGKAPYASTAAVCSIMERVDASSVHQLHRSRLRGHGVVAHRCRCASGRITGRGVGSAFVSARCRGGRRACAERRRL